MSDVVAMDRRGMGRLRFIPRLKRSLRKKFLLTLHGRRHFLTSYLGSQFLVQWDDVIAREIALHNYEPLQLAYMMDACARLKPDAFIDIGANCGVYSCVLLNRGLVPHVVAFEPDVRNASYLRANLSINNLVDRAQCRSEAIGAAAARLILRPGPASNTGTSHIGVEDEGSGGYEVSVVALDEAVSFSGKCLAIKLDVEGYEIEALSGMKRTLSQNRGIVQIETNSDRAKVVSVMADLGYNHIQDFFWDQVFEKP
jgi:FkbM family methyltransferase